MAEMKRQLFTVEEPVPSIPLYKLIYTKDKKWNYVYALETPVYLNNKIRKKPLYLTGLHNLKLANTEADLMINIEIFCKQDIYDMLAAQRISDLKYREKFESENDISNYNVRTFTVDNKSQMAIGKMVVKILEETEDGKTTFVGRG